MGIIVTMRLETCVHGGQWIRDHFYSFLQKLSESLGSKIFEHPFTNLPSIYEKCRTSRRVPFPSPFITMLRTLVLKIGTSSIGKIVEFFVKQKQDWNHLEIVAIIVCIQSVVPHVYPHWLSIAHPARIKFLVRYSDPNSCLFCSFPKFTRKIPAVAKHLFQILLSRVIISVISVISPILAGHSPSWWFP